MLVLQRARTASPGRKKRITNAMLVVRVVSVMLVRYRATLPALQERTANKERLLATIVRLVNTLHLEVPSVNFASAENGAMPQLRYVMIAPLVITVSV